MPLYWIFSLDPWRTNLFRLCTQADKEAQTEKQLASFIIIASCGHLEIKIFDLRGFTGAKIER